MGQPWGRSHSGCSFQSQAWFLKCSGPQGPTVLTHGSFAMPSASVLALAWSSCSRLVIWCRAMSPAAAHRQWPG